MRILALSNFYPPYAIGGQEESCRQVMDGLRARGHTVAVLTSTHGLRGPGESAGHVHRRLHLEMPLEHGRYFIDFFTRRAQWALANRAWLQRLIDEFRPDVIFLWGMWNLPRSLAALAEQQPGVPAVYRFADYWPTLPSQARVYWTAPGRTRLNRVMKQRLRGLALAQLDHGAPEPALKFEHAYCVSAAVRQELVQAGVPVPHAPVIYQGIELPAGALRPARQPTPGRELRLLYAGRLVPEKGVETLLHALSALADRQPARLVTARIAGDDRSDYAAGLRHLAARAGLDGRVRFLGQVPAADMAALLAQHDVVVVPSVWPEPFARAVLEGMAAGLAVVASSAGGSSEIIRDGETGLLFAPGEVGALAGHLAALAADPALLARLAAAGPALVRARYTFTGMLEQIEHFLAAAMARGAEAASAPVPAGVGPGGVNAAAAG